MESSLSSSLQHTLPREAILTPQQQQQQQPSHGNTVIFIDSNEKPATKKLFKKTSKHQIIEERCFIGDFHVAIRTQSTYSRDEPSIGVLDGDDDDDDDDNDDDSASKSNNLICYDVKVIIERKTWADYLHSLHSGRIEKQRADMLSKSALSRLLFLIEDPPALEDNKISNSSKDGSSRVLFTPPQPPFYPPSTTALGQKKSTNSHSKQHKVRYNSLSVDHHQHVSKAFKNRNPTGRKSSYRLPQSLEEKDFFLRSSSLRDGIAVWYTANLAQSVRYIDWIASKLEKDPCYFDVPCIVSRDYGLSEKVPPTSVTIIDKSENPLVTCSQSQNTNSSISNVKRVQHVGSISSNSFAVLSSQANFSSYSGKSSMNAKECYISQLAHIPGVSISTARKIAVLYPSWIHWIRDLQKHTIEDDAIKNGCAIHEKSILRVIDKIASILLGEECSGKKQRRLGNKRATSIVKEYILQNIS